EAWTPAGACQMVCVSRTERNGTIMTMTNEKQQHDDGPSGQDLVEQLKACGQLDALFEQIDAGQGGLTGDGGVVPAMVKAVRARGCVWSRSCTPAGSWLRCSRRSPLARSSWPVTGGSCPPWSRQRSSGVCRPS